MKVDTANRAFFGLVALSAAAYLLLGAGACALLSVLIYSLSTDGVAAFSGAAWGLSALVAFLALYVLGWFFGVVSIVRQVIATRRLIRHVRQTGLDSAPEIEGAVRRIGLSGRVDVVDAEEAFSFAYGILRSRVAVSRGLIDKVSPAELNAVLEHEHYHLRNRDPLKVVLARALPAAFFYLPVLKELKGRYITSRELAADRRAVSSRGKRSLAGALYKVVGGPSWVELGAAAAIGGPDLLELRVAQLEAGHELPPPGIRFATWLWTVVGAAVLAFSFATAVAVFGDPMQSMMRGTDMHESRMSSGAALPGAVVGFFAWVAILWIIWILFRRSRRTV